MVLAADRVRISNPKNFTSPASEEGYESRIVVSCMFSQHFQAPPQATNTALGALLQKFLLPFFTPLLLLLPLLFLHLFLLLDLLLLLLLFVRSSKGGGSSGSGVLV